MRKKPYRILHQDPAFLVVEKDSGLLSIPGRDRGLPVLSELLKQEFGEVWVVHRIDRDTSGLLVFARNLAAHKVLSLQFQEQAVRKEYLAWVDGILSEPRGTILAPIEESITDKGTMMVRSGGKPSETHYEVLQQFKHAALLKVFPKTGRTHQIRVHMKYIGHPLLVDDKYGKRNAFFLSSVKSGYKSGAGEERPSMARLTLHAHQLRFAHPVTGEPLEFESAMPEDFVVLHKLLSRYDV